MHDAEVCKDILPQLRPDLFARTGHQDVVVAAKALYADGKPVSPITVVDWLHTTGRQYDAAYITTLVEGTPVPSSAGYYLGILRRHWRERQLQELGGRLITPNGSGVAEAEMLEDVRGTLAAIEADREQHDPLVHRTGDDFRFEWPNGITIAVTMLHEASDGLHAEVSVEIADRRVDWGRLNLASRSQRRDLVKKLEDRRPGFPWDEALETVCYEVTHQYRAGEPVVALQPIDHPRQDLIANLLPQGDPTVLFAPPDAGKGWLALLCAVCLTTGKPLPGGLKPHRQVNTLYLDWEWEQKAHERRLKRLAAGLGIHQVDGIFYRRMSQPLSNDVDLLRREIQRLAVGFVVIDSYFLAAGYDPYSAESAGRLFAALRALGPVTSLILTHTSWEQTERTAGRGRPIGTIQVRGQARSEWELRRTEDDEGDTLTVALYHTKGNDGRKHAPIGMRFIFTPGMVRVEGADIGKEPDLLARTSLPFQIRQVLASGALTGPAIAELLGADEQTVRRTLNRMREHHDVVRLPEQEGKRALWGLPAAP